MSNSLRLVKQTNITSTVSAVDFTDVFSSNFDIYQITFSNADADTTVDVNVNFINSSGTILQGSSDYEYAWYRLRNDTFSDVRSTGATTLQNGLGQFATVGGSSVGYILNPFSTSSYTFLLSQSGGMSGSEGRMIKFIGVLQRKDRVTGIRIVASGVNFTTGKVAVYGVRN